MNRFSIPNRKSFFESGDLKCVLSIFNWIELPCTTSSDIASSSEKCISAPTKRARIIAPPPIVRTTEELIAAGLYVDAIYQAWLRGGEELCNQVETSCLRRIVRHHASYWTAFHAAVPPTLESLYLYIERNDDVSAVDLLRRGARLDDSQRSRGVLLELCESNEMPLTVSYIVKNNLIPRTVGVEYFIASLSSHYAELSFYLVHLPEVADALLQCDYTTQRIYHERYAYNMLLFLDRNALDCFAFSKLSQILYLRGLVDDEFIALIRQGDILKWFSDEQLLKLRDVPHCNQYNIVLHLKPLSKWIKEPATTQEQMHCFNNDLENVLNSLPHQSHSTARLRSMFHLDCLYCNNGQAA